MRYLIVLSMLALLLVTGCASMRQTHPPRTATEQLLISKAADQAADSLWLTALQGSSVYLATGHFDSLDKGYAIAAIKNQLTRRGALLVADRTRAEIVVEARSGALSIDKSDNLILGLPSIPLPVPFAASLHLPEIPLLKHELRQGIAKFALTAYDADSGAFMGTTGPIYGRSYISRWRIFLVPWTHTNLQPLQDRG